METTMTDTNMAVGDHRGLLDIIDSLRSQGVSHWVDLPEIIVCGDQSAGKSSVLEAISGMPFPIKDGLCTRFATELVLRRGREPNIKVSITPGESRFGEDKERLESWQPKASINKEGLGPVTDEAKRAMADPAGTGQFYEDILRIELTGPEQPHLTMVDLPGLFSAGNKEQSDVDAKMVHAMVERYMARQRSIILAVVSAKSEYVLQKVTLMAKRADPDGLRTMGLITKPDTLDVGSDSESYFFRLAQNLEEELSLGWHVLKNRNFEERNVSSAERDAIEKEFFSQGLWDSINSSHCGVAALRVRLSAVLKDQILAQLSSLVRDVEDSIRECADRLDRLGPERGTPKQQLSYLLRVSEEYTSLVTQAVEGTYTDPFFGNRNKIDKFCTRLRAVVQSRRAGFAEEIRLNGQSQYIVESESEDEGGHELREVPQISRSEFVEDVANRLKFSKGRELPGLFNPLIVSDLFVEQCEPWGRIARVLAEDILEAAHLTTQLIVEHITASDVVEGVLKLVRRGIEGLKVELDAQVDALLASAAQHPITYNPQLTENVQRTQQARHKRKIKKLVRDTFGSDRFNKPDSKISLNPMQLVDLVGEQFERDMERFGSATAVDYMEAYYKARYPLQSRATRVVSNRLTSLPGCGEQVHR
jgi:GTP-binding protein EngB required for normal cell division